MIKPKLLLHVAMSGISLPTFTVSPAVAKATVYMPSHVAARMLGGRAPRSTDITAEQGSAHAASAADTSHAA